MMTGRIKILHLSSRLNKIWNFEISAMCRPLCREACTYRASNQKNVVQTNQSLQEAPAKMLFTSAFCKSTMSVATHQPGKLKKILKKMGWLDHSKSKLKRSGYQLYEKVCERVLTSDFFTVCDLPDTFYSWFLVTELHVWMLMVRLMAEGEEGRFTRNALVEALWEDSETRSKKLGASSLSIRQEQMQSIGASFQATLFAYDEGLMSDDHVLASALWRRLFSKQCEDPERLECCVQLVRKQMAALDGLSHKEIMIDCQVKWVPLLERDHPRT